MSRKRLKTLVLRDVWCETKTKKVFSKYVSVLYKKSWSAKPRKQLNTIVQNFHIWNRNEWSIFEKSIGILHQSIVKQTLNSKRSFSDVTSHTTNRKSFSNGRRSAAQAIRVNLVERGISYCSCCRNHPSPAACILNLRLKKGTVTFWSKFIQLSTMFQDDACVQITSRRRKYVFLNRCPLLASFHKSGER